MNSAAIIAFVLRCLSDNPTAEMHESHIKDCLMHVAESVVDDAIDTMVIVGLVESTVTVCTFKPALRLLPKGAREACA